jgi:ankyrin repeat protein
VHCQIERLSRCFPQSIRRALNELPKTLDETYDRTLQDIDEEKRGYTYRLFQCLTVSVRPLYVKELVEVFAIELDAETMPGFNANWRPEDAEEAVMSACSTLVTIVEGHGSKVVQFSHFTVKEYLTSSRLANSNLVSHYHIPLLSAHTFLARACLCILLQLDDTMDEDRIKDFPLAQYAAWYWIEHAQFESVTSLIQDEMDYLFDKDKPHFACWVWLHDVDKSWSSFSIRPPKQPDALPLYYAALCGFRDTIERLICTSPEDVNARGGTHVTPLHAALAKGHLEVAVFLTEHGADSSARNIEGDTPLHLASRSRHARVIRALLDHGADPNSVTKGKETSLLIASERGDLVAARLLLEHGADLNLRSTSHWSPLEKASEFGHCDIAQLLFDHGANTNEQDEDGFAPLHIASSRGHLAIARMLIERGVSLGPRSWENRTPLHYASEEGYAEVVRLLLDRGADVNAQDDDLFTALHLAAQREHFRVAEILLEHGADLDLQNEEGQTPLQVALRWSHDELAQLLSKRGSVQKSGGTSGGSGGKE